LLVTQDKTTLQPLTPRSILSKRESPPPICMMSSQHVKPRDVRRW
jgi:hypothetical protein